MGLSLGMSVIMILISVVGIAIGGLIIFLGIKAEKGNIFFAVMFIIGFAIILGSLFFIGLFLMVGLSIENYTGLII